MSIARCKVEGCTWQQERATMDDAMTLLRHHHMLRHPEVSGVTTVEVPPVQQLADVDWWTQAIDAIASYPARSRFTIYEACAHLGEPPKANGWQQLARDAHHLGLVEDVGGVNSKRPGTKGSKTTLWERTEKAHHGARRPA